jgi:hypothetical protein
VNAVPFAQASTKVCAIAVAGGILNSKAACGSELERDRGLPVAPSLPSIRATSSFDMEALTPELSTAKTVSLLKYRASDQNEKTNQFFHLYQEGREMTYLLIHYLDRIEWFDSPWRYQSFQS